MELIVLKNVTCGYGTTVILPRVNFAISRGDFIGVIGPNGGGKTTLIKTLIGLIAPLGGTIEKHIKDLGIGYMPQSATIDHQFPAKVNDVVFSGLISRKKFFLNKSDKIAAHDIMRRIGITDYADRNIGELSGGELQRVLLARALACNPQILVLDEPTTYIDQKFSKDFFTLLKELNESGLAILMISHDLGTISRHVRKIACVNRAFHLHNSNTITAHQLELYDCPVQLLVHK